MTLRLLLLEMLAVPLGCIAGAVGSVYAASGLFALNAPRADALVRDGYGFILYVPLVAGAAMGALTAFGLVGRWGVFCAVAGGIAMVLLLAAMRYYCRDEWWQGPDLLALPFLIAVILGAAGLKFLRE